MISPRIQSFKKYLKNNKKRTERMKDKKTIVAFDLERFSCISLNDLNQVKGRIFIYLNKKDINPIRNLKISTLIRRNYHSQFRGNS